MNKPLLLFAFWPSLILAGGLPETTNVTSENATALFIELVDDSFEGDEFDMFTLKFPAQNENGCLAGRVQTHLYNSEGQHLGGSSLDYDLENGQVEVMLFHRNEGYELGVSIQYCCTGRSPRGCRESYDIERISHLLHNKGFNRTPESTRPAKPGELSGGAG